MPVRMVSDDDNPLNSSDNNSGGGGLMNIFNNFMDPSDNNANYHHDTSSGGGLMNMITGFLSNNTSVNNGNFNISDITNLFHNSQNSNGQVDFNTLRDNISNNPNNGNPSWINAITSVIQMFKK